MNSPGKNRTTEALRAALAAGEEVWVGVRSSSMGPAISEGEEVLAERLEGDPKPGEVYFYEGSSGLTIHRLLYLKKSGGKIFYRFKGDGAPSLDPLIAEENLIARAVRARGPGGERPLLRPSFPRRAALLLGAAARALAQKFLPASAPCAFLGGFCLRVSVSEGVPHDLASKFFSFGTTRRGAIALRIVLDSALGHSDPLTITEKKKAPSVIGSSAFSLEELEEGFLLRVAPSVASPSAACPNALENGLRCLLLELCRREGSCRVLHAAAAAAPGSDRAWVMPGASGTGKTTASRLLAAEGWRVGGDDVIVLREEGGAIRIWGTAFSGDGTDVPKTFGPYGLAGWAILSKGTRHGAQEVSPASVAAAIGAGVQRPPWAGPRDEDAILATAARWAASAPGVRLEFARSAGLGQTIRAFSKRPGGEGSGK